MRMRRKKHLEQRLQNVKDYLILIHRMDKNLKSDEVEKMYLNTLEIFGNSNPIVLDIGCGLGNFAVKYALANPNKNVLAVEMISNVIVDACEKAQLLKISNLKFINSGAEYLNRYITPHTISEIYLNFPCPYFKNSYLNHRLTNSQFLQLFKQLLEIDGVFFHKTDNLDFFEFSIKRLTENGFELETVCRDLTNSNIENIITEYESKFVGLGKPIYYLKAVASDFKIKE